MLARPCNVLKLSFHVCVIAFFVDGIEAAESPLFADGFEPVPEVVACPAAPVSPVAGRCEVESGDANLVVRSNFATPDVLYQNGELLIDDAGIIQCAACDCSGTAGYDDATVLNCPQVLVTPGLINSHEHVTFGGPPANTGTERYDHRHEWRVGLDDHTKINAISTGSALQVFWGEVRQLLGGATSMIGSGGRPGMVRNLDHLTNRDGLDGPLVTTDTFPMGDASGTMIASGCEYNSTPAPDPGEVYQAHFAEGVGPAARNEWLCGSDALQGMDAELPGPSLVHGIALTAADIPSLQSARATVVWSPRSDIMLYGMTAPVSLLAGQGINLALGTNWSITGSMNMLREFSCANQHNQNGLNSYFSAQDLLKMATSNAADAAGVGDRLGKLAPGYVADLTFFDASVRTGFAAATEAITEDIVLVLKGGMPLFGDGAVVDGLSAVPDACEPIGEGSGCLFERSLCLLRETGYTYNQLLNTFNGMAQLYACEGTPAVEPSCTAARNEGDGIVYTGIPTLADSDGDGVPDVSDNCPLIFNPPRPVDDFQQADGDNDGIGDVCDPQP
jgi:hypothetical protein